MCTLAKRVLVVFFVLASGLLLFSCQDKPEPEARLEVAENEFFIRQVKPQNFTIDGRGTIKNASQYDVKQVVVTANCNSCREDFVVGEWVVSDIEKTDEQKDTISYIAAGDEEDFSVRDLVYLYNDKAEVPDHMPQDFEIVILSYETVAK